MTTTLNTTGLSRDLRDAIYDSLGEDNRVYGSIDVLARKAEMIQHFGSPQPTCDRSEEVCWQLDDEDAAAIRSSYD